MRVRVLMLIAACVLVFTTVAWADNTFEGFQIVRVILNGQEVTNDVPAVNFFGRTMLPLRKIAELTGLNVDRWDGETSTVYLSGGQQPVGTVNGEAITQRELYDRMVKQYGASVMNDLIRERLVDQAARQANISVTAAEIDQQIAKIKQRIGGEEKFQAALAQNHITLEQLRDYQAFRLKATKLMTPSIPADDETLKRFFDQNKAQFDTRRVHARHILVATEQEAKEIRAELEKGADFAALAKAKSTDPSAQTNGGDLGFFGPGVMVPEFEQVVFGLEKGAISQAFQSPFGWHVAQVIDVTGTAPDFEALKADVRAAYLEGQVQQRIEQWLAGLQANATITNSLK